MSRVLTAMPAAVLALAVLAGCGQEPTSGASAAGKAPATGGSATAAPQAKRRQMEAMRADCMKKKGFKYVPNVPQPQKVSKGRRQELSGDYAAMREYRQKHGFGVFFALAYPDDPEDGIGKPIPEPNGDLIESLSKTQRKAWTAADETCYAAAFSKLTGKTVTSWNDATDQADELTTKTRERELDGDARLAELARGFGDCLKSKGYPVASLKPIAIYNNGWNMFEKERDKAQDKHIGSSGKVTFESLGMPPNEARPYLAKEIKVALDDLECGKDFYAEFLPKDMKLSEEAWNEFGGDELLSPF
ncbi:hypothetical protein [Streptosporangium sp. NPDC000396]|uniref:hypothetical protein n=1 Tax=Streptosporangium sp. NPDC000396 TaxID=3366185 RepID=UPI0036D02470